MKLVNRWMEDNSCTLWDVTVEDPYWMHLIGVDLIQGTTFENCIVVLQIPANNTFVEKFAEGYAPKELEIHYNECGRPDLYAADNLWLSLHNCSIKEFRIEKPLPLQLLSNPLMYILEMYCRLEIKYET